MYLQHRGSVCSIVVVTIVTVAVADTNASAAVVADELTLGPTRTRVHRECACNSE